MAKASEEKAARREQQLKDEKFFEDEGLIDAALALKK